jgi:hypothetical protein
MLLSEITVSQVNQNNITGFPTTKKRQHITNTVNARGLKFTPYTQTNNLKVEADTQSSGGQHYKTDIQFDDVQYVDDGGIAIKCDDNEIHNIIPLNARHNDIHLSCDCLDFYYRFATFHFNNNSLEGTPPPPYIKKTNRPPVNPNKSLGGCKHLIALADKLTQLRILRWD